MQWKDLAPLIGGAAPMLGKLIGGFVPLPFGQAVGQNVGEAIAAALGASASPQAVTNVLGTITQEELKLRLAALESSAAAQWAAMAEAAKADAAVQTEQVRNTGQSYRSELVQGTFLQRTWRPLAMCVWVATWPVQLGGFFYMATSRDPAILGAMPSLMTALAAWNAAPAALAGVYSWGRTQEKIAGTEAREDER